MCPRGFKNIRKGAVKGESFGQTCSTKTFNFFWQLLASSLPSSGLAQCQPSRQTTPGLLSVGSSLCSATALPQAIRLRPLLLLPMSPFAVHLGLLKDCFWLHCCTMGRSEDILSIFIMPLSPLLSVPGGLF